MKKRTRKKIIKIALVAVILGGYYLVNNMNQIKKGLSNEPLIKRKAVNKETADEKIKETNPNERNKMSQADTSVNSVDLNQIPDFDGETTFVAINNYAPTFSDEDKAKARSGSFEYYSELDNLGRVGVAYYQNCHEKNPQKGVYRRGIGRR